MKQSTFTDEQIVAVLAEAEKGDKTITALCKERAITEQTFYLGIFATKNLRWRNKFGGMQSKDVQRLREMEKENARLKRLLAERDLENRCHERVAGKKLVSTPQRRQFVRYATVKGVSERRSCGFAKLPRSTFRYQMRSKSSAGLVECGVGGVLERDGSQASALRLSSSARDGKEGGSRCQPQARLPFV